MLTRVCLAFTWLVTVASAAPPDSASVRADTLTTAGIDTLAAADSLVDLDAALSHLETAGRGLSEADLRILDELLDAAREMAASGDSEAARLLLADARRLLAPRESPR